MSKISSILPLLNRHVACYVESLILDGKIGIGAGAVNLQDLNKSNYQISDSEPCLDRFVLRIPYGGISLSWEVLFNHTRPTDPPDFIFLDDDFMPDLDDIKSLINWDPTDALSLYRVIQELLHQYKRYNRSLLQGDMYSRLQFEYDSLLEQGYQDIELLVVKPLGQPISRVCILLQLPIKFSDIPAHLVNESLGEDGAFLRVTFQSPDFTKVFTELKLSPRVEHALGGMRALKIPAFPPGACLMDFVPEVCNALKAKIKEMQDEYLMRTEFIAAVLSYYGKSVIEHDSENLSSISLLLKWHDFYFIISIYLPAHFPKDKPVYTFRSIYHENTNDNNAPYSRQVNMYPYSPRWSGTEMVRRADLFWRDYISEFQKSSVKGGNL